MSRSEWVRLTLHTLSIIIIGFSSTVLVVMEGLRVVGATPAQQASAVAALCLAMAGLSLVLGRRYKQPMLIAWSTPGAVLLATATGVGSFGQAVAAFMLAGFLCVLTGLVKPLADAIGRVPAGVAAAMMAGVLFRYVIGVPTNAIADPWQVIPLVVLFFALRVWAPLYAVGTVLLFAMVMAAAQGSFAVLPPINLWPFERVWPEFRLDVLISIGLPLYLVTMASQNLPGFAVMQAHGYPPPVKSVLVSTGLASMVTALFGSHGTNLAVITASMGAGVDTHPDPLKRWNIVWPYAALYAAVGLAAPVIVSVFAAFPPLLVATLAGLALFGPLQSGLSGMLKDQNNLEAGLVTFLVTASGINISGIGSAFWGLVCGLIIWQAFRLKLST